ncbi:MAG: hypothetical protein VZR54_02750 [Ruminococcus sp.]|nr:hypothetical protein [Ruminococcus sp.]
MTNNYLAELNFQKAKNDVKTALDSINKLTQAQQKRLFIELEIEIIYKQSR